VKRSENLLLFYFSALSHFSCLSIHAVYCDILLSNNCNYISHALWFGILVSLACIVAFVFISIESFRFRWFLSCRFLVSIGEYMLTAACTGEMCLHWNFFIVSLPFLLQFTLNGSKF